MTPSERRKLATIERKTHFDSCKEVIMQKLYNYVFNEFEDKHLSGNILVSFSRERNKFIIKPRRYDTALFIKTSRQKKRKNANYEFGGRMKFQSGSYASDLNRYGSEFEVFKKKDKANKRKIANISEKNLERVIVRPQNHKGYASRALYNAILSTIRTQQFKGEIEQWTVRN